MKMQDLFGQVLHNMWKENEINRKKREGNTKPNKRSYVCYVYGQIYAEFLKNGRPEYVMVEHPQVDEWGRILQWLKNNDHIEDYEVYNDHCVVIKQFNEENKIYKKYLEGVERNIA